MISGPNYGRNANRAFILSSGTVGAALDAAMAGRKAIALSFAFFERHHSPEEITQACHTAVRTIFNLWDTWTAGQSSSCEVDDSSRADSALNRVELFNVNVPLGAGADPATYLTFAFKDYYNSLCAVSSVREAAVPAADDIKDSQAISSTTSASSSSDVVSSTVSNAAGAARLINGSPCRTVLDFDFACAFNIDPARPAFYGSDLWAVYHRHVSVTPFAAALAEVDLAGDKLAAAVCPFRAPPLETLLEPNPPAEPEPELKPPVA